MQIFKNIKIKYKPKLKIFSFYYWILFESRLIVFKISILFLRYLTSQRSGLKTSYHSLNLIVIKQNNKNY